MRKAYLRRLQEQGQALVLFALMSAVLLGGIALVVDLGQIYASHRSAQNTADVAALAGAERLPDDPGAAVSRAEALVAANLPDATAQVAVPASGRTDGIEVVVSRSVPHLYAMLLGRTSTTVRASAAAVNRPGGGRGNAIVVLGTGDKALEVAGTADTLVMEGNVWSNGGVCARGTTSSLDLDLYTGIVQAVSGVQTASPCIEGNVSAASFLRPPGAIQDPVRDTPHPAPCDPNGCPSGVPSPWVDFPSGSSGVWNRADPGYYNEIQIPSSRSFYLTPGVYFVKGDVEISGIVVGVGSATENPDEASALEEPSASHPWGGVTFYLVGSKSRFLLNGTAQVKLAAYHENILVWMVDGSQNPGGVVLNGGGNSRLFGTVYAARTHIEVSGNYGSQSWVEGMILADTLTTTGTATTSVSYNDDYATPWRRTGALVR